MRPFTTVLGSISLALVLAACGGNVAVDAHAGVGGSLGGGGSSTTGPTQGTSSGFGAATGAGGATGVGASPSSSGTASSGSSTASSGSSTTSGGTGGGPAAAVFCNGGPCMPGQVCCFNPTGPGDHCGASGQCDPGDVELSCNGPEDCPGSVCCATLDPSMQSLAGIACKASCTDTNEVVVCSKMQPDVCPGGTSCHSAQQLGTGAGYRFCVGG